MNCKICYEDYNISINKPMIVVPCCHTFCLNCLNRIKLQIEDLCPICRNQITLDKPNYAILELLNPNIVEVNKNLNENILKEETTIEKEKIKISFDNHELIDLIAVTF
jgi:hypothetical protein